MKHDDPAGDDSSRDDEIRAALAGLRHDEPMPAHVAARLEATLADLTADLPTGPDRTQDTAATDDTGDTRGTDELAAARQRRRPRRVLFAAAAAAAVAVALGGPLLAVLDDGSLHSFSAGEAESGASASRAQTEPAPAGDDSAASGSGSRAASGSGSESAAGTAPSTDGLPRLTRGSFVQDVQQALDATSAASAQSLTEERADGSGQDAVRDFSPTQPLVPSAARCDAGVAPRAGQQALRATLEGREVLVVVGPQRARAYACRTGPDRESATRDEVLPGAPPTPLLSRRLD